MEWLSPYSYHLRTGQSVDRLPALAERYTYLQNRQGRFWGTSRLLINWFRVPFPGIRRPGRDLTTHLSSCDDIENKWSYTTTPHIRLHGVDKDNVTFTFECSHESGSSVHHLPRYLKHINSFKHVFRSPYAFRWCLFFFGIVPSNDGS